MMSHEIGTRVLVEDPHSPYEGVVVARDQSPAGFERLTVQRDDGVRLYALVGQVQIQPVAPEVASVVPAQAPQAGVTVGGVPAMAPPPMPSFVPPVIEPEPEPARVCFMVPSKGRPSIYHTREDCPRVKGDKGDKRLDVDDEAIGFWELSQCQACAKRDAQVTPAEVLIEALGLPAKQVVAGLDALVLAGFSITPDAVDRVPSEPEGGDSDGEKEESSKMEESSAESPL